jgi:glycosyltransferase involved in cell wall biosynthesis
VSLAHPHKNHDRLLDAMQILSDKNIHTSLVLTIEDGHNKLKEKIDTINKQGIVNIVNLGILKKEDVCKLYSKSKCLVFPSTQETFGLALIESVHMGLDVIASNLDYVYQSIKPSLVFDPTCSDDIADKLKIYLSTRINKSDIIIHNEIDKLIKILIEENK